MKYFVWSMYWDQLAEKLRLDESLHEPVKSINLERSSNQQKILLLEV